VEDGDILNILLKDGSIVPCQSVVAEGDAGIVTSSTRVVLDIGSQKAPNPLLTSIQQDITSVLDLLAVYVKYIGNTNEESSLPLPVALPHKILLHGPSGHGKRSLVEVVASHTGLPLVKVTPADVSTRAMQTTQPIAALVSEARQKGTCICSYNQLSFRLFPPLNFCSNV
jgi:SpoVK/Ycf46/Vps4 family AAA+-type ATPase